MVEVSSALLRGRPRPRFVAGSGDLLIESAGGVGGFVSILSGSEPSCLLVIPWLAYTLVLLY